MNINREQTTIIKGIAITMMILFHLFGCNDSYEQSHLYTSYSHIPHLFSLFCGNTVAAFVLITGYATSLKKNYDNLNIKQIFKKTFKLYITTWIIDIIFIPIILLTDQATFSLNVLLKTILCLPVSYNSMYWYIPAYIILLLLYKPIIKLNNYYWFPIILLILIVNVYNPLKEIGLLNFYLKNILNLLPFLKIGTTIHYISDRYLHLTKLNILLAISLPPIIGMCLLSYKIDIIYSVFCLIALPSFLIGVININSSMIKKFFILLGNQSMIIWLSHGFLFYYYYKFFYAPKFWLLIFISFLFSSYLVSIVLQKIVKIIIK